MNNRIMKVLLPSSALLFSFFVANAQADTITYTQDGSDFTTLPSAWTPLTPTSETGTVYVTEYGSDPNVYRSPYENVSVGTISTAGGGWALTGYNTLPYTSIEANGSATYVFGGPENQLTILWGSPDLYNTLTFLDQNGNPIGSLTAGSTTPIVTGDPLAPQTLGHDLLTFLDTGFFYGVVLTTGQNAFEFADLQANLVIDGGANTTPLPAALPLFASGLVAMGLLGWRRKRKPQAAAA